jgi:hypothetical protein
MYNRQFLVSDKFLNRYLSSSSSKVCPLYSSFPSPKTKFRYLSLSLIFSSLSSWFVMLRLTQSVHLSLDFPLLRVPSGFHSKIFSGSLFPVINRNLYYEYIKSHYFIKQAQALTLIFGVSASGLCILNTPGRHKEIYTISYTYYANITISIFRIIRPIPEDFRRCKTYAYF